MRIAVLAGLILAPRLLPAQCPDGTPPPCAEERRAREAALRRAAASAPDAATALIVPLTQLGPDSSLLRSGAEFAAIVAENMTVGDVRGRLAVDLRGLTSAERPRTAARRNAGALVDGTIANIGTSVRVSVRLVEARSGREVAGTTVEGHADSLLGMANRASAVLLKAWWRLQPGPHAHGGLTTASLPALRNYIEAMTSWRRGGDGWVALLDSAVKRDPGFIAAWLWLGLPHRSDTMTFWLSFGDDNEGIGITGSTATVSPDSARRALSRLMRGLPAAVQREAQELTGLSLVWSFDPGALEPPTPRRPDPCIAQPMWRTVEEQYLAALAERSSALLGCDGGGMEAARRAHDLDPAFVPAWKLLFERLVSQGDTAGARAMTTRYRGSDTAVVDRARRTIASRFAPPSWVLAQDADAATAWLFLPWHRFEALRAVAATVRERGSRGFAGEFREQFAEGLRAVLDLPAFAALGQLDSARAVLRTHRVSIGRDTDAYRSLVAAASIPWLPPDTTLTQLTPDTATLDSLDRRFDSVATMFTGAPIAPEVIDQSVRVRRAALLRVIWFAGVLANQNADRMTAMRAAEILRARRRSDSTVTTPMLNGLLAEIAHEADSGALAESLLVQAISWSSPRPSARYRWLLAARYAATDQPRLALRLTRSITMPTSWVYDGDLVLDHAFYYAPALKLEGEMLERLDRREEALARYREFVELRSEADEALQRDVADVRERIGRLERAGAVIR